MPRRVRRFGRYLVPIAIFGLLAFATGSAILFYQGRETLHALVEHGATIQTTDVYAHAVVLDPRTPLRWTYVIQTLEQTGYQKVSRPSNPGEYSDFYPTIAIALRPFTFPEGEQPSTVVRLQFEEHRLSRVDASSEPLGGVWRLEPKRLARWGATPMATREQVRIETLPKFVPQAVVAMEDKRFYQHGAFDGVGLARALYVDLRYGRLRQGASTITQQLARSIFLSTERTVKRKVFEASLALYLEAKFSKDKILEMYLNQVYWGQDAGESLLGLSAASRSYFGKTPDRLTLGESAMLAGLLQSPNLFSPRTNPKTALARRNVVLRLMRDQKLITPGAYAKARREPLAVAPPSRRANDAAYFLQTLQDDLEERFPDTPVANLGWRLFTTLDPVLQRAAVSALKPKIGEGALVALDPQSGAVRAWVGGSDFQKAPFDRAGRALRQPGSAFKPFVFLAALDKRVVTLASWLKDEPMTLKTAQGPWSPQNYDRQYRKKATVWDSLVWSYNVPSVDLALRVGLATVAQYARQAGILSELRQFPSMALGASEVGVAELTNAYGTIASGGVFNPVFKIEAIVDRDGAMIESHSPSPLRMFDPAPTYLVTQMLEAVLKEGTARAASSMGLTIPAAGKTGTSENYQDAWFVGYTPDLVCGVWVGHDRPKSLGHAAAGIALPIWVKFMAAVTPALSGDAFAEPPGIVRKTIDPETGELARSGCPSRRDVSYLVGTEPTKECETHAGGITGFFKRLLGGSKRDR